MLFANVLAYYMGLRGLSEEKSLATDSSKPMQMEGNDSGIGNECPQNAASDVSTFTEPALVPSVLQT
jgi:hypothetical protein